MEAPPREAATRGVTLPASVALLLLPISAAVLIGVGAVVLDAGLAGLVITQVAGFALPTWVAARRAGRAAGRPTAEVLGLVAPTARAVAGAVLVGLSLWYVTACLLVPLVEDLVTEGEAERLLEQIGGPQPVVLKLIALALTPAICEELLFRGAAARGLRAPLGPLGAALASSAAFGLMHGSLARLPITFALGLVLAVATLRTGSLIPAMIIHVGNNAAAVLLSWPPLEARTGILDRVDLVLPVAALATTGGLFLLWRPGRAIRSPS